jgi:hypothetical protein
MAGIVFSLETEFHEEALNNKHLSLFTQCRIISFPFYGNFDLQIRAKGKVIIMRQAAVVHTYSTYRCKEEFKF